MGQSKTPASPKANNQTKIRQKEEVTKNPYNHNRHYHHSETPNGSQQKEQYRDKNTHACGGNPPLRAYRIHPVIEMFER